MSLSKFLPEDFDENAVIELIAGKGVYPCETLRKLRRHNLNVKLIAIEGETEDDLYNQFSEEDRARANVGQLGKLLKYTKKFGAKYAIMAGQVTPKKLFKGLVPDLKALTILATLKERNAETIFGAIANELEKVGCKLLDARSFLDEQIAAHGFICGRKWNVEERHLLHGLKIAHECARLDIGQSCVVSRGSVLAVEAWEGTDKMLERAGSFEAKDSLFVKTVKPNQDYRFDVPVIGERTIRKLAASNILNAAVEADSVIILEPEKTLELANKHGIKIFGI